MQAHITVFQNQIESISYQLFPNNFLSRCLHVANISLLSFSEAPSGLNMIKYFSLRHNLHVFVEGLKGGYLASIFQVML